MIEEAVLVRRSLLDSRVWFCMPVGFGDQSDWEFPGGLAAVKQHAEMVHGESREVRWVRVDPDTWRMTWV